jgi:hypothetical protein
MPGGTCQRPIPWTSDGHLPDGTALAFPGVDLQRHSQRWWVYQANDLSGQNWPAREEVRQGRFPGGRAHLFAVDWDTRITSVKPTPKMVQRR